ncbi:MAG: metallophosphoesterase [Thermotogae bacterium]|nr:metallophosphoesterase [Thermotogota bacterium]
MKMGVISDSHDNLKGLKWAFEKLKSMDVENVVHLGDIISPFVLKHVRANYEGRIWVILGNNDGDVIRLQQVAKEMSFCLFTEEQAFLELNGRSIVLMHEPRLLREFAQSGDFDLVLYGHTHEMDLQKVRNSLILNPGEIYGYINGKVSFAVVDLETLEVKFYEEEVSKVETIAL